MSTRSGAGFGGGKCWGWHLSLLGHDHYLPLIPPALLNPPLSTEFLIGRPQPGLTKHSSLWRQTVTLGNYHFGQEIGQTVSRYSCSDHHRVSCLAPVSEQAVSSRSLFGWSCRLSLLVNSIENRFLHPATVLLRKLCWDGDLQTQEDNILKMMRNDAIKLQVYRK